MPISKKIFFVLGAFFVFFVFAPKVFAYDLVNISATICDFGTCRQATIVAITTCSTQPGGSGFNIHVGETMACNELIPNPNAPLPSVVGDFPFPVPITGTASTTNGLVEFAKLTDLDSLAINVNGTNTVFPPSVLAQFPNVIFAAFVAPPAGMSVVQGPYAWQVNGGEQLLNIQLPGQAVERSDVEVADVDEDGKLEFLFVLGNAVHAMHLDGGELPGFPVFLSIGATGRAYGVSVRDYNVGTSFPTRQIVVPFSDTTVMPMRYDIAIISSVGQIYVIPNMGFPQSILPVDTARPLMVGDLNNDGAEEIVVVTFDNNSLNLVVNAIGGNSLSIAGYPATMPLSGGWIPNDFSFALGNVDSDPAQEIVFLYRLPSGANVALGVYDSVTGSLNVIPSFLPSLPLMGNSPILLANVDSDPAQEILFARGVPNMPVQTQLFAINANGSIVAGWPAGTTNGLGSPNQIVAGDIDTDGINEVGEITTGSQSFFENNGVAIAGFPTPLGTAGSHGDRIADIDQDGALDIVGVSSGGGLLNATRGNGSSLFSLPVPVAVLGDILIGPTIADLDSDGVFEAVWIYSHNTGQSNIFVWKIALWQGQGGVPFATFPSYYTDDHNTNALP